MSQKSDVLFVGIDLGTSRSSISAGNGQRQWIESYVGWPKDFVAAQVVGKPVLFGAEALEHRLMVDVCRPLQHGIIKEGIDRSEEAVKEIIRHLIELAGPGTGQKVHAVVGVPSDSLKINRLAIRKAVGEFVDSLVVVTEPFAVAYSLGLLNNALVIDIGAGTTDLCIMHGTLPAEEDQRTLLQAGDYIDDQLFSYLQERYPRSTFNKNMVRQWKEQFSFVGDSPEEIKVVMPVDGKPMLHDIKADVKRACESILPAIIEAVTQMIARFDPEFQAKIRKNIVLAGGGSLIGGLRERLQAALKEYGSSQVTGVKDPLFAGSDGALKLAQEMPAQYWEKL
ncbi:MAG TPA: MamK family actin-like protein [Candidatus Methanoperedens sp.]|nr:MamK family actin-like protein [Candidatus Methanoperedens sp.]